MIFATALLLCTITQPCQEYHIDTAQSFEDCKINTNFADSQIDAAHTHEEFNDLLKRWHIEGIRSQDIESLNTGCRILKDSEIP